MSGRGTVSSAVAAGACALVLALAAGSAAAAVAPVSAGPPKPAKQFGLDFNGFFPSSTRIHVGDSVRFAINGFHTVSFLAKGQQLPPLIIPSPSNPISGKLDAAGAPFWFNAQPNLIINPLAAAPSGGKKYAGKGFLNSGLPAPEGPPKPFVVKFTKAGTFTFNCIVHPGMKGTVKVLSKKRFVPSAAEDSLAAKAQQKALTVQALLLGKVKPPANTIQAGNDAGSVAWLRFFPAKLSVKVGTPVEFKIASSREVHTFTFGAAPYLATVENTFTSPQPNAAGPPTLIVNPLGGYPSDPPPLPPYTGSNHGNGFEGSGVLSTGGPPLPSSVRITFTKPGDYSFDCVIHPFMHGKIVVKQ
jgi:plastocyanin